MRRLCNALPILLLALAFAGISAASPTQPVSLSTFNQASSENSMVAKGELQKVDTTNQTFTIKASTGEVIQFSYNESTKVEGSNEGVQGLSSQSGTQVTVRYKEDSGRKLATSITIQKS